ncbi:MAG: hypothetical protein LBU65_17285, partial [Planctomycetaceae bacterium]|nr:hypothetical protein [Planctomycetaceae bacterium]
MKRIENLISNNWYPQTLGLFSFPFWCLLTAVFGFIVGIPVTKYHAIVAFALSLATMAWAVQWNRKKVLGHSCLFSFIIVCSGTAASFFMEQVWDGLTYHKPATIEMKNGWNPVWCFNPSRLHSGKPVNDPWNDQWIRHYSKADWIINAVFYAFSGNLDLGHLTRVLYLLVAMVITFISLKTLFNLSNLNCFLFSLITTLEPNVLSQMFCGYLDGALGNCLSILFFSWAAYLKNSDKRFLPFVIVSIVIATNLKFTGVVYAAVFLIVSTASYYIADWWNKGRVDHFLTRPLVTATILALIVGINPYLHNLARHHHPFFPLMVTKKKDRRQDDFMRDRALYNNMKGANRFQQFAFSYLVLKNEMSAWSPNPEPSMYKVPRTFTLTPTRLFKNLSHSDIGLGDLFIIPMWFSLFALPFIRGKYIWIFIIAVWASILVQPYIWFPRYIPHLWLIPIITFCSFLSQTRPIPQLKRRTEIAVYVMLLCLFVTTFATSWQQPESVIKHFIPKVCDMAKMNYFYEKDPHSLSFDLSGIYPQVGTYTHTAALIPDCFPGSMNHFLTPDDPSPRFLIGNLGTCPVYLNTPNS